MRAVVLLGLVGVMACESAGPAGERAAAPIVAAQAPVEEAAEKVAETPAAGVAGRVGGTVSEKVDETVGEKVADRPAGAELVPDKLDVKAQPEIYPVKADGQQLYEQALARAKAERKRVLVTVGGNWCVWCHKLHMLLRGDAALAARLERSYVELLLDTVAHEAVVARLAPNPKDGVPYLFVLAADGEVLARQETGSLEVGPRHDPGKVLAFLDAQAGG